MRKGDETRLLILNTAEKLFCANGFDAVSVQDILNVIHGSKGGFYHHFESKEALLGEICARRAQDAAGRAAGIAGRAGSPRERLNLLLQAVMPFSAEDVPFMSMLLPILDRPGSAVVRVAYQDALAAAFRPMLEDCISEAAETRLLFPIDTRIVSPMLTLVNACWYELCLIILHAAEKGHPASPADLLPSLTTCRKALEALLDAPYGSIELHSLEQLATFAGQALHKPTPERGAES